MTDFDIEKAKADSEYDALLIKQIVERFLAWPLPENFNPDGGISYSPAFNTGTPYEGRNCPSGTNLLDYMQAEAMVRYILSGVDLLDAVEEEDWPLTESEQAKIDAAWERHKAAKPAALAHIEHPAGDVAGLVERLRDGADRFLKWVYEKPYSGPSVISIPTHRDNIDMLLQEAADALAALSAPVPQEVEELCAALEGMWICSDGSPSNVYLNPDGHEAAALLRQQARELADAYAQIEQTNRWHAEALDKLDALTKAVAAVREDVELCLKESSGEASACEISAGEANGYRNVLRLLDQHLAAPAAAKDNHIPEVRKMVSPPSEGAVSCHESLVMALGRLIEMVDKMAKPPSKGGGVLPIDSATTMFEARAAHRTARAAQGGEHG